MSIPKSVLVSHFPLPYNSIASWTTMMNNLLTNKNEVDYVICPFSTLETKYTQQFFIRKIW